MIAEPILRSCSKCGREFRQHPNMEDRAYVCTACRRPRTSKSYEFGKRITPREWQVIRLIAEAKLNKEIAYELHLSEGTIKEYSSHIYGKTGCRNRVDLAIWAQEHHQTDVATEVVIQSVS